MIVATLSNVLSFYFVWVLSVICVFCGWYGVIETLLLSGKREPRLDGWEAEYSLVPEEVLVARYRRRKRRARYALGVAVLLLVFFVFSAPVLLPVGDSKSAIGPSGVLRDFKRVVGPSWPAFALLLVMWAIDAGAKSFLDTNGTAESIRRGRFSRIRELRYLEGSASDPTVSERARIWRLAAEVSIAVFVVAIAYFLWFSFGRHG